METAHIFNHSPFRLAGHEMTPQGQAAMRFGQKSPTGSPLAVWQYRAGYSTVPGQNYQKYLPADRSRSHPRPISPFFL